MKIDVNITVRFEDLKELSAGSDELRQWVRTSIEDFRNWVHDINEYGRDYGTPAACASEPPAEAAPAQKEQAAEKAAPAAAATTAPTKTEPEEVTLEMVRTRLAALVQSDKQAQVKELIEKYGGGKLSEVPPENFPKLLAEAEGL